MTSWREEYIQNLKDRDTRERETYQRFDPEFIDAYTALLDRTTALEASAAQALPNAPHDPKLLPTSTSTSTSTTTENSTTQQLRTDLANTLRTLSSLQSRLKISTSELAHLRSTTLSTSTQLSQLTNENVTLKRRLKDREEELRGKAKLLDDVHDEAVSLELQLNMAEQREEKLRRENKELIDRWMARMGMEAEAMNRNLEGGGGKGDA